MSWEFLALPDLPARVATTTGRGNGAHCACARVFFFFFPSFFSFPRFRAFPSRASRWEGMPAYSAHALAPAVGQGILTRRSAHRGQGGGRETGSDQSGVR